MDRNEVQETLLKYLSRNGELAISYYGDDQTPKMFANCIQNGEYHSGDAPDMLLKKDGLAIIIEHFEVDCSYANRKGSTGQIEAGRIKRKHDALPCTEEGTFYHDDMHIKNSYEFLIQNVTKSFEHHNSHIELYKKNLRDRELIADSDTLKIAFMIDDVSPLGTAAVPRGDGEVTPRPVLLAHSQEFLSLMQNHPNVDYILACSSAGSNDFLWFIDWSQLTEYLTHAEDYQKMEFIDVAPHVFGYKVVAPEAKLR